MPADWTAEEIAQAIGLLRSGESVSAVADALGRSPDSIRKAFQARRLGPPKSYVGRAETPELDRAAALGGWSPAHDMTRPAPVGFHIRGHSTLYDEDGKVRLQWVKTQVDREAELAALVEALAHIAEPFRGTSENPSAPTHAAADLLAVYPIGDAHCGMYAWGDESGDDFDLEIAEGHLVAAVDKLSSLAPPASHALVVNVGDFFHTDNASNRTARSGNALDVDTRWAKVFRVGVRAMRRVIDQAAAHHETVEVWNVPGNHDDLTSQSLSVCLSMYYENNPRVTVSLSPAAFYYRRFGAVLIGSTHGDNVKAAELPGVMAHDCAADWGETSHRHWYTGHVHHDSLKEYRGCTVETVRTLAAKDAWHARSGYRSGRDMKLDVWHARHGMVNRHVVGVEMLGAA